tara:strand:- start:39 stop:1136 length:1098 start_codon:yes stop_codon:yes gene_type:complete
MEIILTNQVLNAASQTTLDLSGLITAMQSSGMSNDAIKTVLMNDLRSGGRIFGSFRNSLKNITKNGVEYSSNQAQKNIYADAKVPKFQWVSVGDNSVCPDCDRRNGQVEPMEYWETVGLPKSGFSICQTNCRCPMPVPASYTGENLDKPLLRGKRVAANLPKKYQKLRTTDLSAEQLKSYNTLARAKSTGKITNDQWQNGLLEILEGKKVGAKGLKVDYRGVKESVVRRSKQSRVRTVNQLMTDGYTERQAKLIFRNVEEMMDMKSPDVSYVLDNMDKYERLNGAKKSIWRVVPKNGRIESGDFVFDSLKGAETFREDFGFIRGQPDIVRLKVNASDLLKPKAKNLISKDYGQELIYLPKSIGLK